MHLTFTLLRAAHKHTLCKCNRNCNFQVALLFFSFTKFTIKKKKKNGSSLCAAFFFSSTELFVRSKCEREKKNSKNNSIFVLNNLASTKNWKNTAYMQHYECLYRYTQTLAIFTVTVTVTMLCCLLYATLMVPHTVKLNWNSSTDLSPFWELSNRFLI